VKKIYGLSVLVALALGTGCEEQRTEADQCLRRQLFAECMKMLPAGPAQTHYNDWSDVVEECGSQAYYQSIRRLSNIPVECR
jgi:hypothetical protein